MASMNSIFIAVKRTLSDRRYLAGGIVIAAVIFSALFLIQVKTVPGNSGQFQITLFGWKDWMILAAIAILNSFFITIEIYAFNLRRALVKLRGLGGGLVIGGVGTSSGILASIFSTASCSLCVSAIFGFLGANSIVFLVSNRGYVVAATLFLLLSSLYLSSKRFSQACEQCRVD